MVIYLDDPEAAEAIGIAWQYTPDHISKYFSLDDQEGQHMPTETTPAFATFRNSRFNSATKYGSRPASELGKVCVSAVEWDTHCCDSDEDYDSDYGDCGIK